MNTVLPFWAIKHIPTGTYLPAPRGRGGRGGTRVSVDGTALPRLFTSEQSAKASLRWWLAGEVHVYQEQNYEGEYNETWETIPKADRVADDMEVVPVSLTEHKSPGEGSTVTDTLTREDAVRCLSVLEYPPVESVDYLAIKAIKTVIDNYDTINALQARVAELEGVLRKISKEHPANDIIHARPGNIARAVLPRR